MAVMFLFQTGLHPCTFLIRKLVACQLVTVFQDPFCLAIWSISAVTAEGETKDLSGSESEAESCSF